MIGQAVSHYRMLRAGGGGMGVVYEAEDTRLGRRVALKFLTEERAGARRARALRARGTRRVVAQHLNICTIFDGDEHEGRPFIAMELLEGATLTSRIDGRAVATDELLRSYFRSYVSVSPDEEWILRHQHSLPQSELMLVENFR